MVEIVADYKSIDRKCFLQVRQHLHQVRDMVEGKSLMFASEIVLVEVPFDYAFLTGVLMVTRVVKEMNIE
jgi:hypothetical protein